MSESAGSIVMCYEIRSGRTATRTISTYLTTLPGEAEGIENMNVGSKH